MAIANVSIVPLGTKTTSLSRYVAKALKTLQSEPDVKYELTPMGTIIEGDMERILSVVQKMHRAVIDDGAARVYTTITIDDRHDKPASSQQKVASAKRKLSRLK
jgi:uncharacterized protein (TIGR00106 family)